MFDDTSAGLADTLNNMRTRNIKYGGDQLTIIAEPDYFGGFFEEIDGDDTDDNTYSGGNSNIDTYYIGGNSESEDEEDNEEDKEEDIPGDTIREDISGGTLPKGKREDNIDVSSIDNINLDDNVSGGGKRKKKQEKKIDEPKEEEQPEQETEQTEQEVEQPEENIPAEQEEVSIQPEDTLEQANPEPSEPEQDDGSIVDYASPAESNNHTEPVKSNVGLTKILIDDINVEPDQEEAGGFNNDKKDTTTPVTEGESLVDYSDQSEPAEPVDNTSVVDYDDNDNESLVEYHGGKHHKRNNTNDIHREYTAGEAMAEMNTVLKNILYD